MPQKKQFRRYQAPGLYAAWTAVGPESVPDESTMVAQGISNAIYAKMKMTDIVEEAGMASGDQWPESLYAVLRVIVKDDYFPSHEIIHAPTTPAILRHQMQAALGVATSAMGIHQHNMLMTGIAHLIIRHERYPTLEEVQMMLGDRQDRSIDANAQNVWWGFPNTGPITPAFRRILSRSKSKSVNWMTP